MSIFFRSSREPSKLGRAISAAEVGSGIVVGLGAEMGSAVGPVTSAAGAGSAVAVGSGLLTLATDARSPLPEEQATSNSVIIANTEKINFRIYIG
jgi:hypothetical protein